ncbi:beta-1,6-N-acetylglucosaminyltransferase [Chitinophaga niabensis]|uniref:Peptide O-xylosyltransferase n=1 Tax=Chitinophaga niabensis TaxID=536979 RepID=A0A1N6EET3_9BACT|nr:beta-1,6-N-acetylglucosaminyltransferase [Chitinophaga niabensis]SIN81565.1 Core-2/I-Branching enzyme [Chitinophaga niabensis]
MRIAFIILAHKNPAQLHRLLTRLQHPNIDCFVHIDRKCKIEDYAEALSLPQVYTITPRVKVTWAGWSIVQATLNGMEAIRQSGKSYTYITMLSGQDYVIKTTEHIYQTLIQPGNRQYIGLISEKDLKPMMSKVDNYHLVECNFPGKYKFASLLTKILPARKTPFGLKIYSGSGWWTLTQDCVNYLLDYIRERPQLVRYFKLTWGSDEFIFQTILMGSPYKEAVTGYDLHYIDWGNDRSKGQNHPKTLGVEDVELMLKSDRLVARKFEMDKDPALLDKIDQELKRLFP